MSLVLIHQFRAHFFQPASALYKFSTIIISWHVFHLQNVTEINTKQVVVLLTSLTTSHTFWRSYLVSEFLLFLVALQLLAPDNNNLLQSIFSLKKEIFWAFWAVLQNDEEKKAATDVSVTDENWVSAFDRMRRVRILLADRLKEKDDGSCHSFIDGGRRHLCWALIGHWR